MGDRCGWDKCSRGQVLEVISMQETSMEGTSVMGNKCGLDKCNGVLSGTWTSPRAYIIRFGARTSLERRPMLRPGSEETSQ